MSPRSGMPVLTEIPAPPLSGDSRVSAGSLRHLTPPRQSLRRHGQTPSVLACCCLLAPGQVLWVKNQSRAAPGVTTPLTVTWRRFSSWPPAPPPPSGPRPAQARRALSCPAPSTLWRGTTGIANHSPRLPLQPVSVRPAIFQTLFPPPIRIEQYIPLLTGSNGTNQRGGGVACGPARQVAVARRTLQNKRLRIALAINQFTPEPWEGSASAFWPGWARWLSGFDPASGIWGAGPARARDCGGLAVGARGRAGSSSGPGFSHFLNVGREATTLWGRRRGSRGNISVRKRVSTAPLAFPSSARAWAESGRRVVAFRAFGSDAVIAREEIGRGCCGGCREEGVCAEAAARGGLAGEPGAGRLPRERGRARIWAGS
uniref:uncharacterized protein LOC105757161 n=1 Tax=Odobenus rosmarus divergens TaxID=9708 RepID=UPI00063C04A4|nr:PREDICTED: uncharacterized protein LOC105757161 [Odobenus rosmarus divergens]